MEWYPHVTVATVVEHNGKFLLVEEHSKEGLVFNQPAGHLEAEEDLPEAAIRETLEETGWHIELLGIVGIGLYTSPHNGVTYHRTTFFGKPLSQDTSLPLDEGIHQALWLSYEEILQQSDRMRSHLVIEAIERYRSGHKYPMDMMYS